MAYIIEPGPDRQLGPTVTAGGGGYDSPHSRRERRAKRNAHGIGSSGNLYAAQRHFALQLMHKYGIPVPPGVDPVKFFHEVGSKLIWQKTHGGRGQQATMGQEHPGAASPVRPPAFMPPAEGGNIGQQVSQIAMAPRANPMAGLGANVLSANIAGLGQNLANTMGAHGAGAPVTAPGAKPVPKPKPASHAPTSAHAAGFPAAKQAKHKLALDLLVSALTAKPPAFHGLANTFQHGL